MTVTINLRPTATYRRDNYGVLLESETVHDMTGSGLHNRHHPHRIEVWENRPSKVHGADPDVLVTPHGDPTEERYTILTSAQAVVISDPPQQRDVEGPVLAVGSRVALAVNGFEIGEYVIHPAPLRDPVLLPLAEAAAGV